jgi:flagellar basal-body rod modification protein FlgD
MNISHLPSQTYRQAAAAQSSSSTSNNANSNAPNNTLTGNSFITLLTAQLQAQDPSNPMDPNQMVNELVAINSLQQLIQIQQDLSGGVAATAGSASSAAMSMIQPQTQAQTQNTTPSPSYHDAVMQSKFFPAQSPASF